MKMIETIIDEFICLTISVKFFFCASHCNPYTCEILEKIMNKNSIIIKVFFEKTETIIVEINEKRKKRDAGN